MMNKEAINLIDIIRIGYICDPQECGEIATGGTTYEGELCDIFKCDDFHEACVMAIEALEKQDQCCGNCAYHNELKFHKIGRDDWCSKRYLYADDDMWCTDWSEEE